MESSSRSGRRVTLDGQFSPTCKKLFAGLIARFDEVVDATLAGCRQTVPAYAALDDPAALRDVRGSTHLYLSILFESLMNGASIDEKNRTALSEIGGRRAKQRFPLYALLRASQIGIETAWQFVLEELARKRLASAISPDMVAFVSATVLGLVVQMDGAIAQSYLAVENEIAVSEARLQRSLLEELVEGPLGSMGSIRERVERAGYRLGDRNLVAILLIDRPMGDSQDDLISSDFTIRRMAGALRDVRLRGIVPLVGMRGGAIIGVFPALGLREVELKAQIEIALEKASVPSGIRILGALGRFEPEVTGIAASYRQAVRALEAARAIASFRIASYIDVLPYLLLLQEPSLAVDVYKATVAPLARHDTEHEGRLVPTLLALFEERGNFAATAKRLFVHRHTLSARLQRVEELTGWSPMDRLGHLLLELGLRAGELVSVDLRSEP